MSDDAQASEIEALRQELAEARRQQVAMAEALEAVTRSSEDRDATFRSLLRTAARLCEADNGGVWLVEGDHLVGTVRLSDDADENAFLKGISFPLSSTSSMNVRCVVNGEVLQVNDTYDGSLQITTLRDRFKHRSALNVPIILNGVGVGLFALLRDRPSVFTEAQIALVRGFAAQAAIVVRNVRQFQALEARTAELNEALEQQTATAETLKTLSRSAFDLDAVLNTLVRSAAALCGADTGGLAVESDGQFKMRATHGMPARLEATLRARTFEPGRNSIIPRVLLSGVVEMVLDSLEDPEFI
jgi:GAF domain-containing protein